MYFMAYNLRIIGLSEKNREICLLTDNKLMIVVKNDYRFLLILAGLRCIRMTRVHLNFNR